MRSLLLVLLALAATAPLTAQTFSVDPAGGLHRLSTFTLESRDVARGVFPAGSVARVLPDSVWLSVTACAAAHGAAVAHPLVKPTLWALPDSAAYYVHDTKVDSLVTASESLSVVTTVISRPVVGWAFIDADVLTLLARFADQPAYQRHEALHLYAWYGLHALGHPVALYAACAPEQLR